MTKNAWDDVELGDHLETSFRAVIEIPKGSKVQYELDKRTVLLSVYRAPQRRPLPGETPY